LKIRRQSGTLLGDVCPTGINVESKGIKMGIATNNIAVGIGAAVVATVLAPVLIPVLTTTGRPLAKTLIKSAMLFYEKSREALAVAGEVAEDLMAEIRAEEALRRASSSQDADPPAAPAQERHTAQSDAVAPSP
jgi:hypothetical protein